MTIAVVRGDYREGRGGDEPCRELVDPIGDLIEHSVIRRTDDFAQPGNISDDVLKLRHDCPLLSGQRSPEQPFDGKRETSEIARSLCGAEGLEGRRVVPCRSISVPRTTGIGASRPCPCSRKDRLTEPTAL